MKKITKCLLTILLTTTWLFLTGCASTKDPSEAYLNETATQIFVKAEEALKNRDYKEAINRFEALDIQYPLSPQTEMAQLHIIYAYYREGDYLSAESAADRFIHAHPANPYVDYALYMRGMSNYYQNLGVFEKFFAVSLSTRDLTQMKKSYNDFAELYRMYPTSCYAAAAHQQMIYLKNLIAIHELQIAQFYYSREAYIAAANRANLIVRYYQGSPAVPEALVVMVKSYRRLGLTKNAEDALQVLTYNYPNSKYVARAIK